MQRYSVLLIPAEEGGYTVRVPALPEIVTEGDTFEQALTMARDAIDLVLQSMVNEGEEIPIEAGMAFAVPVEVEVPSLSSAATAPAETTS
ncbi:MAG: type II toxin-antitoxin system HicB family antitoxin [Dehalococcoidia bacterium]